MKITVACTQMHCSWDIAANVERAESLIHRAADAGAQIILLQELFETPLSGPVRHHEPGRSAAPRGRA
jgi:N-carbamoylputrescine amidase